jgi:hypothetical protein
VTKVNPEIMEHPEQQAAQELLVRREQSDLLDFAASPGLPDQQVRLVLPVCKESVDQAAMLASQDSRVSPVQVAIVEQPERPETKAVMEVQDSPDLPEQPELLGNWEI